MPSVHGRSDVSRYIAMTPKRYAATLRGAARAGAEVIADGARERSNSDVVTAGIAVRVPKEQGPRISAIVYIKPGWARTLGNWQELGTAPHLISIDASQSRGRTAARINRLAKDTNTSHSLVIGGKFVGSTVFHPGAQPSPFMRPALDITQQEAFAAAQAYIDRRGGR